MLGVDQQVADRLVFLAKLRRERKEQLVVDVDFGLFRFRLQKCRNGLDGHRGFRRGHRALGRLLRRGRTFAAEKVHKLGHKFISPAPMRAAEATHESLCLLTRS
jgi:hypothetical protein